MLEYLLKNTLCWSLLYAVYALAWRREHSFQQNRAYLLLALATGLILPQFSWESTTLVGTVIPWEEVTAAAIQPAPVEANGWSWLMALLALYLAGVAVGLGLLVKQLVQLRRWYMQGEITRYAHYTLVQLPQDIPPFSFGHCLFVSRQLWADQQRFAPIYHHELAHIRQRHTWDVLVLAVLRIVFWFQPVLGLYQRALRDQHEYAADAAALNHTDLAQYGRLLLDQSVQLNSNTLTHLFFHSPLKKRIFMMTDRNRASQSYGKYPLSLGAVALLTWQISAQQVVTLIPDVMPYLVGCSDTHLDAQKQCSNKQLLGFIYNNIQYPEQARNEEKEGMTVISFLVLADGSMADLRVMRSVHPLLDAEALRVLRLAQQELTWMPATLDGKAVKTNMNIPIRFKLK